jgi:asparagine synthase (glutamine-hydrolysing)
VSALAGIWYFDGNPAAEADCARMLAAQEIYGPHDGRAWSEGGLALGRRLFRTLPEDIHDRQPLTSRDGRLTLAADVRLDYRDELERELGIAPDEARQTCDAGLLLACLERWGERALDRLAGDFAFALWDRAARKLLLVRDFRGRRPLHFHRGRGFFAFSTMAKGLHALPDVPKAPDEQMVAEALALMPQRGERTFFKDIGHIEAGHIATVTPDGLTSRAYWQPQRMNLRMSDDDYVEGLRHHLDRAVQARLRGAGGTVGAHLSAGYDSGAVATTAARLMAQQEGKVIAFTSVPRQGYDGPAPRSRYNDEGPLAAATAAMHANIEHVLIHGNRDSPLDGLDRHFFLFERPVLNLANAAWGAAIHKAARARKLGVVLSGQMGNMTISYGGETLLPELVRAGRLLRWRREAAQLVAKSDMRWRGALVQSFGWLIPAGPWRWLNRAFLGHAFDLHTYTALSAEGAEAHDLATIARARNLDFSYRPRADGFETRLWVMRRGDGGTGGKGILAGWGIDMRDPTADKRLVEFCLSVPSEQYLKDGISRSLAKRAFADRLPQAVLNEGKKGYQAADWHEGATAARDEIAAELERLADCAPAAQLLDIARLKRLVANWPTSGWERDGVMQPYRLALLRGISAGHFLRKASGGNR